MSKPSFSESRRMTFKRPKGGFALKRWKPALSESLWCLTLIAVFAFDLGAPLKAQTFTNLYSFSGFDGSHPRGDLAVSGNTLFGTTIQGGSSWGSDPAGVGHGTVFAINSDGTGFQTLYNFTGGMDGSTPFGGIILSGNTLYGTAEDGGNPGGSVFSVNTDGTGFTALYDFSTPNAAINTDGAGSDYGLVLIGNTLYGVAGYGGTFGNGVVFRISTNGTGFATLHNFTAGDGTPSCELVMSGNTLYVAARGGGHSGSGTIYSLSTDGTGFTNLYSFTAASDGDAPEALVLSGTTFYGTARYGGTWGNGTVFAVNTDGTGFRVLHTFTASGPTLPHQPWGPNRDGSEPAGLMLSGTTLYGVARGGGSSGDGTVFSINTNGTGFTTLHSFSARDPAWNNEDGWIPQTRLVMLGGALYGTAFGGGAFGYGTVFSISLPLTPPQLTIATAAGYFVLTWPTNATNYTLQSATDLGSSTMWTNVLPSPAIVKGQNTVINPVSGSSQFYRLIH
jgi:uncharacterized repeat protein (TIGR03803 family)